MKRAIPVLLVALMLVVAGIGGAANTQEGIVSEHTTTSDFENARVLDNMTAQDDKLTLERTGAINSNGKMRYEFEQDLSDSFGSNSLTDGTSAGYGAGKQGSYAKKFDGSDDYLKNNADPSGTRTYSVWVNPDTLNDNAKIMGAWGGGVTSDLAIYYDDAAGKAEFRYWDGSETNIQTDLPTDQWTHLTLVYKAGNEIKGYKNGNLVNTKNVGNANYGSSLYIGGSDNNGGTASLDGRIDDARVYTDALTTTEIQTIANQEEGEQTAPGTYKSQYHTVEDATSAKLDFGALTDVTADVTIVDGDGNTLGTGSYTTAGEKTISLSGQTNTSIQTQIDVTANADSGINFTLVSEGITATSTAPSVDNSTLDPEGTLLSSEPTFTVDVSDPDFDKAQGDEVTAELFVNGNSKGTDTLTSNGTASVTAKVTGDSTYYWEMTDKAGLTTTSESVDVRTPSELYVFNETAPYSIINDTTVEITATGSSGTTTDLLTTSDGNVTLEGLPPEENYVFTVDADGYYPKEIYVEDLFSQQNAYLLPKDVTGVSNRVTVSDRTGKFGEETILIVDRVIDTDLQSQIPDNGTEWVIVGGDRLGQSGFYSAELEQYGRYRFRVRNSDGDTRILGEYTAKSDGLVDLQIGSVQYDFGDGKSTYQWDTSLKDVDGGNYSVTFAYNDYQKQTSSVTATIKFRGSGKVFAQETFDSSTYGEIVYTVPVNESIYENKSFIVDWEATRNGSVIDGSRLLGGDANQNLPLAPMWIAVGFGGLILSLAFLVGAGAGPGPALVTVALVGAFSVFTGLAPPALGIGSTLVVLMMGGAYTMQNARGV
jgi:hypothetical protein